MELYQRVYTPLTFLMGETDNLSLLDIAQILKKNKAEYTEDALTPVQIEKVNQALIELAKSKNRIKPKIEISCRDKINFMPQRYLADNEVLQELVDVTPNSKRAYPKGLDLSLIHIWTGIILPEPIGLLVLLPQIMRYHY